ncbi:hypothetical protein BLNAU_13795 [Blattamonas nauphoetae]|uniref:Uncharacterized protein n=1 Tax=Blattamonas nauphoetae TaxID=2049346 RepID=A0ABQ9XFR0_9EUKA|nr:hypothetical protein BLNAU_13795 [Blattamonas nauphoetae]
MVKEILDLRPELCRRIHEQIALPTLRLLNTAGISFSAAQPEEEAVEDEGEQDDGDADDIQPENEQLEHKDKNAEKQYEEMDEDAGSEQNADAKKTRMTKLSKANISTMKILTLPEVTLFRRKEEEEEFEDQLEYEGEKGDSIDHQPDKEPEHHSETNDNDDEIVKKEHFRETGGGEEGSVRETATSARSSSSCASFTTSSKNTPKLTPSDSPLLIDTTSVQFDNLLPVSPAAPKHETVLVDTSVPLFDDSIFFNADFSSRFLSRCRPSSQSFFVDHGYSISDHLVSKRHLLPLPFCGEEGVGLAQTIISSVVSAFSTTSDSRHENSFGPSSTFSFTPISQNIYNRTDNPASLFIPPSPTPQQAASAPSPLSTLLNLCPHEMFTLTSDDLPMVDHLLRKGFTQFNPPASGSPNAALNRD